MNLIERSATKIAKSIRANYPDAASEKVLIYALSLLINTTLAMIVTMIICFLTGYWIEGIITIFVFLIIRYLGGGVHLGSSVACCVTTIILLTGLAHIKFSYEHYGLYLDIASLLIMILKAPDGIENVSRIDPKYYIVLKIICVLFVISNFFIKSPILSAIYIVQSVSMTKLGYGIVDIIERRWRHET